MDQFERNKVITSFKKKEVSILVATDVAGRIQEGGGQFQSSKGFQMQGYMHLRLFESQYLRLTKIEIC
jgi:superfamily II DNA/RNA helicase